MSKFTQDFKFQYVGENIAETASEVVFYKDDNMIGEYAVIPIGTKFNGATQPEWLAQASRSRMTGWMVRLAAWDPWDPRILPATILHDWLVGEFDKPGKVHPNHRRLSWKEAAEWFDEALRVTDLKHGNVSWLKRKTLVNSVLVYGKLSGRK